MDFKALHRVAVKRLADEAGHFYDTTNADAVNAVRVMHLNSRPAVWPWLS